MSSRRERSDTEQSILQWTAAVPALDERLVARLYAAANAGRWLLPVAAFRAALEASAAKAFAGRDPGAREMEKYLAALHLDDLALACACADGSEAAWEHVIRNVRPALYRAADALDRTGNARELADSIYADLYGVRQEGAARRSLFRYFHGRSSLVTWLRSVLAQRHVDAVRARRRAEPLPDADSVPAAGAPGPADPDASRWRTLMRDALASAIERLAPKDRLRLGCYYAQQLTGAETGRVLREHEATVSRHLARTRKAIRRSVEETLSKAGLADAAIDRCFEVMLEDPGSLDLDAMFSATVRKVPRPDRSHEET
jgi:RNA polymerase sigma-70 factor (ECF subfamily)